MTNSETRNAVLFEPDCQVETYITQSECVHNMWACMWCFCQSSSLWVRFPAPPAGRLHARDRDPLFSLCAPLYPRRDRERKIISWKRKWCLHEMIVLIKLSCLRSSFFPFLLYIFFLPYILSGFLLCVGSVACPKCVLYGGPTFPSRDDISEKGELPVPGWKWK